MWPRERCCVSRVYHRPNDDITQPIRWDAGARFAQLNYRIARMLADQDRQPQWQTGDYFGTRVPAPPPTPPPAQPRR